MRVGRRLLLQVYRRLLARFGPRHWWPARTPFEVAVGAVLTQNTAWVNVERAIANLQGAHLLSPRRLLALPTPRLARLIRPAGYFNLKAKRLKAMVAWWVSGTEGARHLATLRRELLAVYGVGPETADSILLYALKRPIFVIDAYTQRIFARHGWVSWGADYETLQRLFMSTLPPDVPLYNEYHALLVELGKTLCLKRRPRCAQCPLRDLGTLRLEEGAC